MPVAVSHANDDEIRHMLGVMRQLPPKERLALHLFYLAEQPAELRARAWACRVRVFTKSWNVRRGGWPPCCKSER